jgi:hypothetical protein
LTLWCNQAPVPDSPSRLSCTGACTVDQAGGNTTLELAFFGVGVQGGSMDVIDAPGGFTGGLANLPAGWTASVINGGTYQLTK